MGYITQVFQKQSLPTSNEVEVPDAVRREVNSAVQKVLEEERNGLVEEREIYTLFTPEDRVKIVKYTAQCGNTAAMKHFDKEFPSLGESSVRSFKKQYVDLLTLTVHVCFRII